MPEIQISRIGTETVRVPIIGTMPLIVSNFSEKAKRQMLDAQQGRKSPKVAFKQATVGAARFYGKDVRMNGPAAIPVLPGRAEREGPAGAGGDHRDAADA